MLSNRSSDVRRLEPRQRDAIAERVVDPVEMGRLGRDAKPRVDQPLVIAVARPEHHAVLAERDRPAVAVGGDVANRENGHGGKNVRAGLDRAKGTRKQRARNESRNVSMLPAVRNLAGTE